MVQTNRLSKAFDLDYDNAAAKTRGSHVDHPASTPKTYRRTRRIASMTQTRMGEPARDPMGAERFRGMELPPPAMKTIDLEGRLVKDGVRKAIMDRKTALTDLVHEIKEYRRLAEQKPLTLQGSDYAHAVQELNKAIDRAEGLL
jgi:hypothetical protein